MGARAHVEIRDYQSVTGVSHGTVGVASSCWSCEQGNTLPGSLQRGLGPADTRTSDSDLHREGGERLLFQVTKACDQAIVTAGPAQRQPLRATQLCAIAPERHSPQAPYQQSYNQSQIQAWSPMVSRRLSSLQRRGCVPTSPWTPPAPSSRPGPVQSRHRVGAPQRV